jgi:hypothetical protein
MDQEREIQGNRQGKLRGRDFDNREITNGNKGTRARATNEK